MENPRSPVELACVDFIGFFRCGQAAFDVARAPRQLPGPEPQTTAKTSDLAHSQPQPLARTWIVSAVFTAAECAQRPAAVQRAEE